MSKPRIPRLFVGVFALLVVAWPAAGAAGHGLAAPSIISFSPNHGIVGTRITIYGHDLQGVQMVQFNGVAAASPVVNATGNHIVVVVPPETNTGPGAITITTPGGTVTSSTNFVVLAAPMARVRVTTAGRPLIHRVSPMHGTPGTRISISGTNFGGALWVQGRRNEGEVHGSCREQDRRDRAGTRAQRRDLRRDVARFRDPQGLRRLGADVEAADGTTTATLSSSSRRSCRCRGRRSRHPPRGRRGRRTALAGRCR